MKFIQEIHATKSELETIKRLTLAVADAVGEKISDTEMEEHISHTVRVKSSAGNFMTMLNLNDTYEAVIEMEFSDEIFELMAEAVIDVMPMIGGIFTTFKKLNGKLNEKFEPTSVIINDEEQLTTANDGDAYEKADQTG